MMKRERMSFTEAASLDNIKNAKKLFRQLPEYVHEGSRRVTISNFTDIQKDILEFDPNISLKLKQLVKLFDNLNKYDHKNIGDYNLENAKITEKLSVLTTELITLIVKKINFQEDLDIKILKDDFLKIFAIQLQYVSHYLNSLILISEKTSTLENNKKITELLQQRQLLNQFLLLTLHNRKNTLILSQYDTSLILIIRKEICEMQEKLTGVPQINDLGMLSCSFYWHFETLALMASYNENKKFMKSAAYEGLAFIYETLEKSLFLTESYALFQSLNSTFIPNNETWVSHFKNHEITLCTQFGRQKFKIVHIPNPDSKKVEFTFGFLNLYYAYKCAQLMILRGIYKQSDKALNMLAAIMKRNCSQLSNLNSLIDKITSEELLNFKIEAILNENYICLNFLKSIICVMNDSLIGIERLSFRSIIKTLVYSHLFVALNRNMLYIPQDLNKLSYITHHDHAAMPFKLLHHLKNLQGTVNSPETKAMKSLRIPLGLMIDEIIIDIAVKLEQQIVDLKERVGILKIYLIEYFMDEKSTFTSTHCEQFLKLFEGKIFSFFGSFSLKLENIVAANENKIELHAFKMLVLILNKIIKFDAKWGQIVMNSIFKQINNALNNDTTLFWLFKILYGLITNETYDDAHFFKKLFMDAFYPIEYKEIIKSTLNKYAIQALNDHKGIIVLLDILIGEYNQLSGNGSKRVFTNEQCMNILEKALLILHNVPDLCNPLLEKTKIIQNLLEISFVLPKSSPFVISLVQKCLTVVKYSKECPPDIDCYLPYIIIRFLCRQMHNLERFTEYKQICTSLYDLIIAFITFFPNTMPLDNHQNALYQSMSCNQLLDIVIIHKHSPEAGEVLIKYLEFIKGISYENEYVKSSLQKCQIFANNVLPLFILESLKEVNL